MAYDQRGYQGQQQRPYAGPAATRPAPRQYEQGPPPPQQQQQQYDDYQDDYAYGGYDDGNGYGQDYGGQYPDQGYGRGPPPERGYPPQDYYGPRPGPSGPGRGGRPVPQGRGGPGPARGQGNGPYPPRGPPGPGPGRGYGGGPPPGRGGRPMNYERSANSDPSANRPRDPTGGNPPLSPNEAGFGSPFPVFPGQQRKPDFAHEQQIINQMGAMEVSQRPTPAGRGGPGPRAGGVRSPEGDYGRPPPDGSRGPPRGYPAQGFEDRRGPNGYNQGYSDDGYGPGPGRAAPPRDEFGGPNRSMTMPVNDPMARRNNGPPQRMDSMPYNGGAARGVPPRPSTSQSSHRPPPQRTYPTNQGPPGQDPYSGSNYGNGAPNQGYQRASFDDAFDDYYGSVRHSNPEYPTHNPPSALSEGPDFSSMPPNGRQRNSFDQHMMPAPLDSAQPQQYPGPQLSKPKSQPDLRQQQQIYEMAGDAPPLPTNGYQAGYDSYGQVGGEYPPQRRPSLPTNSGPRGAVGFPQGPSPALSSNPDGLPSHPAPIRPGLMPNSVVNMNSKPAPVRNYNGGAAAGPPATQQASPEIRTNVPPPKEVEPPVTTEELERLRMVIKNDPADQASALRLAKKLVEASDTLTTVGDPKVRARNRDRFLMDANKILKKLASGGQNPEAMFFYADCLGKGMFGAEPDNKEAFTLYQSAAKLGHAAAAYRTAVCCEIGNEEGGGTRKDPLKAIQWYKRAATLGDTPAMYKVGMILLKGLLGQPKNPREAVGWLKRAAERADAENPHALHELGLLYESAQPNDAILRDEAYAFSLFKEAAELGYKFSQFRLGCAYEYGLMGCPIDPRLSIMWYSRAATQEEHQSELALSGWYLTGTEGVLQQSDTEAYLWARKAAMAGLAKAEYAMGYFTEVGIGVPANLEDAKRWYWRAAAQDFPKARERLEDLKRVGKTGPRPRERISRSKIGKQQEGECVVM